MVSMSLSLFVSVFLAFFLLIIAVAWFYEMRIWRKNHLTKNIFFCRVCATRSIEPTSNLSEVNPLKCPTCSSMNYHSTNEIL